MMTSLPRSKDPCPPETLLKGGTRAGLERPDAAPSTHTKVDGRVVEKSLVSTLGPRGFPGRSSGDHRISFRATSLGGLRFTAFEPQSPRSKPDHGNANDCHAAQVREKSRLGDA